MEVVNRQKMFFVPRTGEISEETDDILEEHQMDIYVNDTLVMKVSCTPSYLKELVYGRLLTEGFVQSANDIETVYICDEGYRAKVYLKSEVKDLIYRKSVLVPTCCTDNKGLEVVSERLIKEAMLPPFQWKTEWVFDIADTFAKDTELHKRTMGNHSCILARQSEVLISCEDIGRHNAVDKVLGWGMCHHVNLSECILYTSGRIPMDMVRKAIRAHVPILASKAVPTIQAVEMANAYGLVLIGAARPDRMKIFSGQPQNRADIAEGA